ncbi:MAG: Lpp/OprI family alanine-zipper lipoprotein [Pseudomonadota bacterium]|nr:Lpp/OprI family alanine-zipper lipoprotein [Pseudomonadota bacterium]
MMEKIMTNSLSSTLKLSAIGLSLLVVSGCAAQGGEQQSWMDKTDSDVAEARSMANEALGTANSAQRDAQAALKMARENRQAMDRMFQKSMQK